MYSDNGINLVAGEKEIAELLKKFDQEQIGSKLAKRGIEWHFSPSVAPHFGGSWERLIQSAKSALRIILDGRTVAKVLHSGLVGAAAFMNARPLEYVPDDPQDPIPSTPNHFVLLEANPTESTDQFDPRDKLSSKGWRAAQVLVTHFWLRWLKEIVPKLNSRSKWTEPKRSRKRHRTNHQSSPPKRRMGHSLGRVKEVFPGPYGVVRSASIAIWTGTKTKTKLCTEKI